jgi:hypothetical protein
MDSFLSTVSSFYLGRANRYRYQLKQDGEVVQVNAVTRAQFKVGPVCLDTDVPGDEITLTDNATVVEVQPGLADDLEEGMFEGMLTIYDVDHPEGIAWARFPVYVYGWEVCEVEEP